MQIVYEIALVQTKFRFELWMEWVTSAENIAADALSRFDFPRFFDWAKFCDLSPNLEMSKFDYLFLSKKLR